MSATMKPILEHLGLPTEPPGVAPARGPSHVDDNMDERPLSPTTASEPGPAFEFDRRVSW